MIDYFSESEAKGLIGNRLEAKNPLPSVTPGTVGTVIGANSRVEGWVVQVRGKVQRSSFLNLMVVDACLNIPRKARTITGELSKSDLMAKPKFSHDHRFKQPYPALHRTRMHSPLNANRSAASPHDKSMPTFQEHSAYFCVTMLKVSQDLILTLN
jgi:hypothetical protein